MAKSGKMKLCWAKEKPVGECTNPFVFAIIPVCLSQPLLIEPSDLQSSFFGMVLGIKGSLLIFCFSRSKVKVEKVEGSHLAKGAEC